MQFATSFISIMVIATQAFAGVPSIDGPFIHPRPLPQQVNVHLVGDTDQFGGADAATVYVDRANDKLSIDLYKNRCNHMFPVPGVISCKAMPTLLSSYEVRLEKISDGVCGAVVYEGSDDKLPVDGPKVTLVISDNREFGQHCLAVRAQPQTTGTLTVELPGRGFGTIRTKTLSFEGGLLK